MVISTVRPSDNVRQKLSLTDPPGCRSFLWAGCGWEVERRRPGASDEGLAKADPGGCDGVGLMLMK